MPVSQANCVPMPADRGDITDDAILGGRLRLLQPRRGHRFGHDAVLLAAAVPARPGDRVVEFGCGVGAAGLALHARVGGIALVMLDIDPELVGLAQENIARNAIPTARAATLDVTAGDESFVAIGLQAGSADCICMNPPFNIATHPASPDPRKRAAHLGASGLLEQWSSRAAWLLKAGGTLTLIWRASEQGELLRTLERHFGGLSVLPIHGKPGQPPVRILVRGEKAVPPSQIRMLSPLVLNDTDGNPNAEAERIMRHMAAIQL